jgi:hypothetical protein
MIAPNEPAGGTEVTFTRAKLDRFRKAYERAVREKESGTGPDTFRFEGNEYYIGYAKYMIWYLDRCFEQGLHHE